MSRKFFESNETKTIELSNNFRNAFYFHLKSFRYSPYCQSDRAFFEINHHGLCHIWSEEAKELHSNQYFLALLKNLPIDQNLVDTPESCFTPKNKDPASGLLLLSLCAFLGYCPYLNHHEHNNSFIHNIVPLKKRSYEASGLGTKTLFDWHVENIHLNRVTKVFTLLCLRGDKNAQTGFLFLSTILDHMPKTMFKQLLEQKFKMSTGPSYKERKYCIRPILERDSSGEIVITYNGNQDRMNPCRESGKVLLNDFKQLLSELPHVSVTLQPGEAVIVNNRKVLHKRNAFKMSAPDRNRRWLERLYMM